jgi:peroxiredoxin
LIVAGVTSALGLIGRRARKASAPPPQRPRPPRDLHGLPLGAPAPAFELPGSCGTAALSLASLRAAGLPVVLIFLDESCGACRELHPHLHRWQVTLAERVTIGVITTGTDAAGDLCTDHGVENVLVDAAGDPLWGTYEMPGTPSAVAVAADGSVASAAVRGAEAIEELVRQTIRQGAQTVETWKQLTPVA